MRITDAAARVPAFPAAHHAHCALCLAFAALPPIGQPAGWDGFWRHGRGWTSICPDCLENLRESGGRFWIARMPCHER